MTKAVSADSMARRRSTRIGFFIAGFVMAGWAPQVPYAKARLGVDDGTFGLYLLCLGIGSIVAMPLTGALVARLGARTAILAGGIGMCLALPLIAVAATGPALAIGLILFGSALGMIDVAINVHAIEVEQAAATPLMSGFHGLFSLGGLTGASGAIAALSAGLAPGTVAMLESGIAAVLLLVAARGLMRARPSRTDPSFAVPRGVVVLIGALAFAAFLTEGALLDWGALLLSGSLGFDTALGGIGYAIFSIAMTAGRLTGDRIVGRFGPDRVLLIGGIAVACGFAWLLLVPLPWLALAGFLMIGGGAANLVPVLFSAAGRQQRMPQALAVASISTLGYAGILLGPALIGFVAQATSLRIAFALLGGLMLSFALLRRHVPVPPR